MTLHGFLHGYAILVLVALVLATATKKAPRP